MRTSPAASLSLCVAIVIATDMDWGSEVRLAGWDEQDCSYRPGWRKLPLPDMPFPPSALLSLGMVVMAAGAVTALCAGMGRHVAPLFVGLVLGLGGAGLVVAGLCAAMRNLQAAVPGHFLLHPRTGTRFSPHQALAIQRRLDRIRREMSTDSVATAAGGGGRGSRRSPAAPGSRRCPARRRPGTWSRRRPTTR
ncbi:unnamed protein product [Merluccius merluccius]